MIPSRVVSFFALFLTFGLVSFATPTPITGLVEKRAEPASVETVFTTLKGSTDTILPEINALVANGTATEATVTPLVQALTSALNTATGSLDSLTLQLRVEDLSKRQSDQDVANLVAGIITDITNTLDGLLGIATGIPTLSVLLGAVDAALNQVLLGLEIVLAGVLQLVATLLVDVAGLLQSLAFGLTLATLGL